jgi:hypothetical protein
MDAQRHKEEECLDEEVACPLCKDRMLRRLLQGHKADPVAQATHMDIMATRMAELEAENATLKRKVGDLGDRGKSWVMLRPLNRFWTTCAGVVVVLAVGQIW